MLYPVSLQVYDTCYIYLLIYLLKQAAVRGMSNVFNLMDVVLALQSGCEVYFEYFWHCHSLNKLTRAAISGNTKKKTRLSDQQTLQH